MKTLEQMLNIKTAQDAVMFEKMFDALFDHNEQPHSFWNGQEKTAVLSSFYTVMVEMKKTDSFDPDECGINTDAMAEWLASCYENDGCYSYE